MNKIWKREELKLWQPYLAPKIDREIRSSVSLQMLYVQSHQLLVFFIFTVNLMLIWYKPMLIHTVQFYSVNMAGI